MSGSTAHDVQVKKHLISSCSHREAFLQTLFCSFMVEKKNPSSIPQLPQSPTLIGLGPLIPRLDTYIFKMLRFSTNMPGEWLVSTLKESFVDQFGEIGGLLRYQDY